MDDPEPAVDIDHHPRVVTCPIVRGPPMISPPRTILLTLILSCGLLGCRGDRDEGANGTREPRIRAAGGGSKVAAGKRPGPAAASPPAPQVPATSLPAGKGDPPVKAAPKPPPPPPPWQVVTTRGAEATLDTSADGVMTVAIPTLSDGTPWHVQLMGPVVRCTAGSDCSVSFRARAGAPRDAIVMAVSGKDAGENVGLAQELALTEEWRSYRFDFEPRGDTKTARLRFNLGMSGADVEVADVAFGPRRWFLERSAESTARLETLPGLAAGVRVVPDAASDSGKPWSLRLGGPTFSITEGGAYYVSLRARADKPRKVIAKVAMGHEPWEGLGCYRAVELGTAWRSHGFVFTATAGDPAAQFDLLLGDSDTPLELQSASVRPAAAWRVVATKDHEAVLTFPAADGQRPAPVGAVMPTAGELMRVDFDSQPQAEPWRVRLAAAPQPVRLDADYEIVFKARAERPRDVTASLRRADGDGQNIGLYATVSLTDAWQTFTRRFTAKATTDQACVGFELGGSDAAVEIADVMVRDLGPHRPTVPR